MTDSRLDVLEPVQDEDSNAPRHRSSNVTREQLYALCGLFGFDKNDVSEIKFLPTHIEVVTHRRNNAGNKYVIGTPGDPTIQRIGLNGSSIGYSYSTPGISGFSDSMVIGEIATRTHYFAYAEGS